MKSNQEIEARQKFFNEQMQLLPEIIQLPIELWMLILSNLVIHDKLTVRPVSKQLKAFVEDGVLWHPDHSTIGSHQFNVDFPIKEYFLHHFSKLNSDEKLETQATYHKLMTDLKLAYKYRSISEETFQTILKLPIKLSISEKFEELRTESEYDAAVVELNKMQSENVISNDLIDPNTIKAVQERIFNNFYVDNEFFDRKSRRLSCGFNTTWNLILGLLGGVLAGLSGIMITTGVPSSKTVASSSICEEAVYDQRCHDSLLFALSMWMFTFLFTGMSIGFFLKFAEHIAANNFFKENLDSLLPPPGAITHSDNKSCNYFGYRVFKVRDHIAFCSAIFLSFGFHFLNLFDIDMKKFEYKISSSDPLTNRSHTFNNQTALDTQVNSKKSSLAALSLADGMLIAYSAIGMLISLYRLLSSAKKTHCFTLFPEKPKLVHDDLLQLIKNDRASQAKFG